MYMSSLITIIVEQLGSGIASVNAARNHKRKFVFMFTRSPTTMAVIWVPYPILMIAFEA